MIVLLGVIIVEPGVATPPIPLSISTASAFVTAPQLSVLVAPWAIELGDAVNDEMAGMPEHAVADEDVLDDADDADDEDDVEEEETGAPPTTLIFTVMACPNNVPAPLRIRHVPE